MTRFKNKIGKTWSAGKRLFSQRYLRIMFRLQEKGKIFPEMPSDVVCECPGCGKYVLGRDWPNHRECMTTTEEWKKVKPEVVV